MKQKKCKTSSILIDLENSPFNLLVETFSIYQYELPSSISDKANIYSFFQNWAKDNLDQPYYINIPSKRIYVLIDNGGSIPVLMYENVTLSKGIFAEYSKRDKVHILLKLLLAKYFQLTESFVSNDRFYVHASVNKANTWATVLRVDLSHNYKNAKEIEFFVKDEATRLKSVSFSEFNKYYSREIAYGQTIKNGQAIYKQLKRREIEKFEGTIFVKPSPGLLKNSKAKIHFHSILDSFAHETSKSFLLERFCSNFLSFISGYGLKGISKELDLIHVDSNKDKQTLSQDLAKVTLIDGRRNKTKPLSHIFTEFGSYNLIEGDLDRLDDGSRVLFVMDYTKDDFSSRFQGEDDPYLKLKTKKELISVPKQGICVNENCFEDEDGQVGNEEYLNYAGLGKEDLQRNLTICLAQLALKETLLKNKASLLPNMESLKKFSFCFRNYLLFVEGDRLEVEKFDSGAELLRKLQTRHKSQDIDEAVQNIYDYHNPFPERVDFDFLSHKLMFSNDGVFEIIELPERAFYDEEEIRQRINERNKKRSIVDFRPSGNGKYVDEYNQFVDENVSDALISYEELKAKYGRGEDGFFRKVFNTKDERAFVRFLNDQTEVQVKGLKQDNIFSTYTGIWFDQNRRQYFVGRTLGYQHTQDKGSQIRKIICHAGELDMHDFFSLLNVDFIRYKEITVNPFPFKLIEMYETLASDSLQLK
jgi:hypothetical protein